MDSDSTQGKDSNALKDWSGVYQRLDALRDRLERGWVLGPEDVRRRLDARAAALARVPEPTDGLGKTVEVVEFLLAYERYAVGTDYVREVCHLESITAVPCVPSFVLGIINVRGEILSVVDIKKFFDLPERGLTDLNKVIVLESGAMTFGILADAIVGVDRLPERELQRSLPTLNGIRAEYLYGVAPDRTVVLDAGKLLSDERMLVNESVPL